MRLRERFLPSIRQTYPDLDLDAGQLWEVLAVNGGYGREALQLGHKAMRITVWRCHVIAEPRCDYCGQEGHSTSTGTTKCCPPRADDARQAWRAAGERLKKWREAQRGVTPPPDDEAPF